MTIKDSITIISNFLSSDQCEEIIDYINKNKDTPLFFKRVGVAHNEGIAYRTGFPLHHQPNEFLDIKPIIEKYSNNLIQQFYNLYNVKEPLYLYMVGINRLTPGIQFQIHQDADPEQPQISYSSVIYLNDDYADGEIVFLNNFEKINDFDIYSDDMNGFVYKPVVGDAVMFPAETWHGGRKVLNKDRDCLLLWFTKDKSKAINWS